MKRVPIYILLLFTLAHTGTAGAQPVRNEMQYLINPSCLSPALFEPLTRFSAFYTFRDEWTGFTGSPIGNLLDVSGTIRENMLIGGQIQYLKANIYQSFYFTLRYAIRVRIEEEQSLSLGIGGILYQNSMNLANCIIDDPNDPLIEGKERISQTRLNLGAGLTYRLRTFSACVASPMILNARAKYSSFDASSLSLPRNFFIYLSNDFRINRNWLLKPAFRVNLTSGFPTLMEISLLAGQTNRFWASAFYRTNNTLGLAAGVIFWQKAILSYGYEFFVGSSPGVHTGTHEITLGIRISETKITTPELKDYFSEASTCKP